MSANISGNRLEYLCQGTVLFPNEDEGNVPRGTVCIPNNNKKHAEECPRISNEHIPVGECNTILSAYTLYRHLG